MDRTGKNVDSRPSSLPVSTAETSSSKDPERQPYLPGSDSDAIRIGSSSTQAASSHAARSYASVVRASSSRPTAPPENSGGTLTASLRRFAANLTSSLAGDGAGYTLLPSAPTDTGRRVRVYTESEQSDSIPEIIRPMAHEQTQDIGGNGERGRAMKRPRSFPATAGERMAANGTTGETQHGGGTRSTIPHRQDYLRPDQNGSTSTFSDRSCSRQGKGSKSRISSRSCSRHGGTKLSAHSHHSHPAGSKLSHRSVCSLHSRHSHSQAGASRFTHHSSKSHHSQVSRPSDMIRRPTSTFVVGPEPREEGPSVVEMKTALVQRALDESGMGRYQWCM